jgi:hypothetical protein
MAQRLAYGNALKSHDDLLDALWFRGLPPVHGNAQGGYAVVFPSDLATESPLHKRRVGDAERLSEGGCRPAGGLGRTVGGRSKLPDSVNFSLGILHPNLFGSDLISLIYQLFDMNRPKS